MRTVGRAAAYAASAALLGGGVVVVVRKLAGLAHRSQGQEGVPLLVLLVVMAVYITRMVRNHDIDGWIASLCAIATVMLYVHISLLDTRALREHGLEQHARITKVQTRFNADDSDYQVYTLEALDGPPIDRTAQGRSGSGEVGTIITVTTDPSGQVAPKPGGLPSAATQLWLGRVDTALTVLLVPVLAGWTRKRIGKCPRAQGA
ncbi:hypothetical protein ACIRS1_34760 [Kitasatospora sp. NPDC101176]|uniref:hypothetical protein n=1 Tax=Kitasatospora sp. NPDC101176 TaxID=3364099 RepID=UPI00381C5583